MRIHKKINSVYHYILALLIVIQPILDIMWLNDGTIPEIMGFTISTLVRMIMVATLGILSFRVLIFNKKFLWLLLYVVLVGVYFIGHQYNCMNFASLVPGDFNYSFIGEAFYVIRMCIPLAVIYFTYNSKIKEKSFNKIVIAVSLIMSLSVISTNILKIALGSYTNERIAGNIFDWFFNRGAFTSNQLASKGFFYFSISSTVMVLLLPYLFYLFMEKKQIKYWIISILQSIALLMIGTKATALSVIIIAVLMTMVYFFCAVIKHDYKLDRTVIIGISLMLLVNVFVYNASPAVSKMEFDKAYSRERDEEDEKEKEKEKGKEYVLSEENPEGLIEFFENNYKYVSIKEEFMLDSYPFKYDPVFWYKMYDGYVPSQRMQNRIIEEKMLQRVKEINNNQLDNWFGIGYTRTSNIYNLEKDFIYQYYSMGALGAILLVGPYIIITILVIIIMLWKFKEKCTLLNASIVLGVGLFCFVAYYSGNTLESLGITIVLGFVLGYLLKSNFKKKLDEDQAMKSQL